MTSPPSKFAFAWSKRSSWIAALALAACGGAGGETPATTAVTPPATPNPVADNTTITVPNDYALVWADEFAADGLPDASKWVNDIGRNKDGWHNNEKQYYSKPRLENAEVRDGKLIITARKEIMSQEADWGGQVYSSARLITAGKRDWTYGFFEVRAKLPCGKGTWPAIWMLGSQGSWPAGGELDIMEGGRHEPNRVFSTVHTTAGSGGNGSGTARQITDACTTFHNYQMHWTSQQISFGIDGKVHHIYTNAGKGVSQWPFDAPQFLILNVAIGGDLGGAVDDSIFPVRMEVEHVRVYQKAK